MGEKTSLKAVALMGATGTGKSALAMRVAQAANTSIICCDSMQLYRGLNIGTAKPTGAERAEVPHFMVDCCDLPDMYSAARWAKEARVVIEQENEQGRIPLIVGGTGLYLRALVEGFADIPTEKPQVRQRFETLQKEAGTSALYQLLQHKDPDMALRLKAGDTQRIMRALCVYESTGKTLSAWQQRDSEAVPIDCPVFVLDVERGILRQRLADRFHAMMKDGWLDEVRWLDEQKLPDSHPALRAVGYRQLLDFLHGRIVLEQAVNDGITATRRYAKRQVTWFHNQTPDAVHGDSETLEKLMYG
ncbi:MAG: tRNA (adenosine(37)-N6)-dimethylallyltransferase MiaA [Mariprofundus sp.]|nr:tRNA (adenosine(37)-N6)-dimethylallyltransferase MiaA [Mariprofundus sp.]